MRNPTTDTGVDVTLIEERLRLTPTERWQWNYEAARLMLALREAGARILDLVPKAVEMTLFDVPVKIMGLDDLIKAKATAGRPKDLAGLEELRALRRLGPTS